MGLYASLNLKTINNKLWIMKIFKTFDPDNYGTDWQILLVKILPCILFSFLPFLMLHFIKYHLQKLILLFRNTYSS